MQFDDFAEEEDSVVMKPGHVRRIKVEDLSSNKTAFVLAATFSFSHPLSLSGDLKEI